MTDQPGFAEGDLRTQVRAQLAKSKISQAEASRRLGCSTKHMNQMLQGHTPLTLDWAERILALCGKRVVIAVRRAPKRPAQTTDLPLPEETP